MFSDKANKIFAEVINKYHEVNTVDQPFSNPYDKDSQLIEHLPFGEAVRQFHRLPK